MKTDIADILKKYSGQIDHLDLELLIAHTTKKTREFVLTYPEYKLPTLKIKNLELKIARRRRNEPLAYILGSKEFFGLPLLVTPATLIPRPETELMVEMALQELQNACLPDRQADQELKTIVDVGTGSGNIIISVATNYEPKTTDYYGIDISNDALAIAKKNSKLNNVSDKIKFLHGNLLEPFIKANYKPRATNQKLIILANLPYLSKEIYFATPVTVKKYEPKSALFSAEEGLAHYEKLLQQLDGWLQTTCLPAGRPDRQANYKLQTILYMEISPEQKRKLSVLIKKYLPEASIEFKKDLAQKWRLCKITL